MLGCFWFLDLIFMGISSSSNRKLVLSMHAMLLIAPLLSAIYLALDLIIMVVSKLSRVISKSRFKPDVPSFSGPPLSRKKFIYRAALMQNDFERAEQILMKYQPCSLAGYLS